MKAALLYGSKDIRVQEVPSPKKREGWVLIRVKVVGICGTDKAFYKGTYKPGKLPIIPGHEISGVVEEVWSPEGKDLVGNKVTTEINVSCGKCWFCRNGLRTHCPKREVIGITIDGGMAEYVATPLSNVHVVNELTYTQAALVEPLAAVLEMVKLRPPTPGSDVAILGAGTIGLLALQVLKLYSPSKLVVITRPNSPKASLAKELGADEVLDTESINEFVRRESKEGQGFDYVVEATGSPLGLEEAIKLVRPRGVVAAKSTHGVPTTFNYTQLVVKEVKLIGSRCGPFKPAIRLIKEGLVNVDKLITSTFKLDQIKEAFEVSLRRDQVKVQIITH